MSRFRFKPIIWDDVGSVASPYSENAYGTHFKKDDPSLPRVNELFQDSNGNTFIHKIDTKGRHRYIDVDYNPSKEDKIFGRFYKRIDMTDAAEFGPIYSFWRIEKDVDIICTSKAISIYDISNDDISFFDEIVAIYSIPWDFTGHPSMVRAVRLLNGVLVIGVSSSDQKKTVFYKVYQRWSDRPSLVYDKIFEGDFSSCSIVDEEKAVFALLYHAQQGTGNTYKVRAIAFAPNGPYDVSYVMSSPNHNQDYELYYRILPENIPFLIEGDYKTGEGNSTLLFATTVRIYPSGQTEGNLTAYGMKCVSISANIPSDFSQTTFSINASSITDTTREVIADLTRVECFYPVNAETTSQYQPLIASSINGKGNFVILGNDGAWIIRSNGNSFEATKHLFSSEEKGFLNERQVFGIARVRSISRNTSDHDQLDNLYLPIARYTNGTAAYAGTAVLVLSVNNYTAALSLLNDESYSLDSGCDFPGSHLEGSQSCNGLQTMILVQNYRSNFVNTVDLTSLDTDLGRAAKVHVLNAIFGVFSRLKTAVIDVAIGYFEGIISKTATIEEADIKKQVSEEIETEVLNTKEIGADGYIVNSDKIEGNDRASQTTSATSLIAYETIEEESSKVLSTDNLVYTLLSVRVGGLNTHRTRLEIFAYKDDPLSNSRMIGDDSPKVLKSDIDDTTFEKYAVGRSFMTDDTNGEEDTSLVYIPRVFSTSVATPIVIDVYRVGFDTTPSLVRSLTLNRYGEYQSYSEKINSIAFHYQDNQIWVIGYVGLRGNAHEYVLFKYDILGNLISAKALSGTISGYTALQASKMGLIRKYGSTIFCIYLSSGNPSFITLHFEEGHHQGKNDKEFYEGIGFTGINTEKATMAMQKDRGFTAISNTAVLVDSDLTDTGTFTVLNWRRTYMSHTTEIIDLNGKVYGRFAEKEEMDDPRIIAYDRSFDSSNNCDFRVWDGFSDEESELYGDSGHVVRKQYTLPCNPYATTNLSNYISLVSVRKGKLVFAIVHGQWATTEPGSQYCITMAKLPINITCASFDQIFGSYGNFAKAQIGSLVGEKSRFVESKVGLLYPDNIEVAQLHYTGYMYNKSSVGDDTYGVDTPESPFKIVRWTGNSSPRSAQFNLCNNADDYGNSGYRVIFRNERTDDHELIIGYRYISGNPGTLQTIFLPPGQSCEFVKVNTREWICVGGSTEFVVHEFKLHGAAQEYASGVSGNRRTLGFDGFTNSWTKPSFYLNEPLVPGGSYDLSFSIQFTNNTTYGTQVPAISTDMHMAIGHWNTNAPSGQHPEYPFIILGGETNANNSRISKHPFYGTGGGETSSGSLRAFARYAFTLPKDFPNGGSGEDDKQYIWLRTTGNGAKIGPTPAYTQVYGVRIL